jgi:chemotaxis protein methyltransferase CheR
MAFRPSEYDAELAEEEFRLLRDLIHEQFGLYYDDSQRSSLRARLAGRLSLLGLLSFEDYYRYLRFAPERAAELARMVSHLTNNETYFFREQPQLQVFADNTLRTLRERKTQTGDRTLRVLSAGCSTGEEAMTLAMIIYDSGQFFWNWDVRIFGMDLDPEALEKAERGTYHQNSMRAVNLERLERHFIKDGKTVRVKDAVRKLVSFRQGNLVEAESYVGLRPLDVIFCRNVLIYFSDGSIRRAMELFFESLVPGGYLFLGHAESLGRITDIFTPVRFQGAMAYQKPGPGTGPRHR